MHWWYKNTRTTAIAIRETCEQLGPVYIKMAQILSTKSITSDIIKDELVKLQDSVPIEDSSFCFERLPLDNTPTLIASGSIAMVYKGEINGKTYAFKLKRPNIKKRIEKNIRELSIILQVINWLPIFKTLSILDRFNHTCEIILSQVDFIKEVENTQRFYKIFKKNPHIIIPEINTEFTTNDVIVMDYIEGERVHPNKKMAKLFTSFLFSCTFMYRWVHQDLHPGNVLIQGDKLVILDFGLVSRIEHQDAINYMEFCDVIVNKNWNKGADIMMNKFASPVITSDSFKQECIALFEIAYGSQITCCMNFMYDLMILMRKYNSILRAVFVNIEISVFCGEGTLAMLATNSDFAHSRKLLLTYGGI